MARQLFKTEIRGDSEMTLEIELNDQDVISFARLNAIGDEDFLAGVGQLRGLLRGGIQDLRPPIGSGKSDMMFRELILRAKGQWRLPYEEAELCHCRAVPLELVDQAIVAGAHSSALVSRWTSASTACGTCRPNVEKLIEYRLKFVGEPR